MTLHTVSAGRLLIRALPNAQSALVGILHLPPDMPIIEGAAYLLLLGDDRVSLLATPLDAGLPDEQAGQGIDVSLRAPIWFETRVADAICVRFTAAFPHANVWTVYGAANQPICLADCDASGHAWVDVCAGRPVPIAAPAETYGETPAQMLTGHPVWPGPDAILYTLCQHDLPWRQHYHRLSKLMARCGRGEITTSALSHALASDPHLDRIRAWGNHDPAYLRYLSALDAAAGLLPDVPRTAEQHAEHWSLVERCFLSSQAAA